MSNNIRNLNFIDNTIIQFHSCIKNLLPTTETKKDGQSLCRKYPAKDIPEPSLSKSEITQSSGMMRVNHSGEVCAQALYLGQALTARSKQKKEFLLEAAREEQAHLRWCNTRLSELQSNSSILKPIWFIGSFTIGTIAGLFGDKWSLGFLAETELQVTKHLEQHLNSISTNDTKSIAVIQQMHDDEMQHASSAVDKGATELPDLIKDAMRVTAKIMTFSATYI